MTKLICNHYNPHDIIELDKRVWRVIACCYGAEGQESVIGLVAHDRALLPNDDSGKILPAMYVPVKILDALVNSGLARHYGLRAQEVSGYANEKMRQALLYCKDMAINGTASSWRDCIVGAVDNALNHGTTSSPNG